MTETEVLADEQIEAEIQPPCDARLHDERPPARWIATWDCPHCGVVVNLYCEGHRQVVANGAAKPWRHAPCGTAGVYLRSLERL